MRIAISFFGLDEKGFLSERSWKNISRRHIRFEEETSNGKKRKKECPV
jgi:hypothetical protein